MTVANPADSDALFCQAVSFIDAGDVDCLRRILAEYPQLVNVRLKNPGIWLREQLGSKNERVIATGGFFHAPYLLWFVAEDPVRQGTLPKNIVDVAAILIDRARSDARHTLQEQIDYALRLVCWSPVAKQCNVQIPLIDQMIDAGAATGGVSDDALVNGNYQAAEHLVERGATLTLATALCLGRWDDVARLGPPATRREKQMALSLAALRGKAEALSRLIQFGVDISAPSQDLYSHATPLHHAVCSRSLDAVKVLVEAGADLSAKDAAHHGTPLGWAEYRKQETIADYLRGRGGSW